MKICAVDEIDIYNSYDAKWKDFEDGVQYSSAKRWGADCIVTRMDGGEDYRYGSE